MADWTLKQGDSALVLDDTLTYDDGSPANLVGATVTFVMRDRSATSAAVQANAGVVSGPDGTVVYQPTAADTAAAGIFDAYWIVTFSDATTQRFPTVGYNTVEIQENLESANQTIVSIDDVKDHLNLQPGDRTHDGELMRMVAGLTPVVENIVGPVLPTTFTETYDGGFTTIELRHRPVIAVSSVIEYRGPIAYTLEQVATPDLGTIYSYEFQTSGRIVRRTAGGGVTTFPFGQDAVAVIYTAGRAVVPAHIRLGMLELVRVNYQQTQQAGRPAFGSAGGSDETVGVAPSLGFLVPNRVREMLLPSKRFPSVA